MHQNCLGSEREQRERVPAPMDDVLKPEAMVVDGVSVGECGWRRWYFPSAQRENLDREGVSVRSAAHDRPREVCHRPPPLYIRAVDKSPQP
jgi:hypothetical protein